MYRLGNITRFHVTPGHHDISPVTFDIDLFTSVTLAITNEFNLVQSIQELSVGLIEFSSET